MMVRRAVSFILLAAVLSVIIPVCQAQDLKDADLETFEGKVVSVDLEKSAVTVKGATTITFTVLPDTRLAKDDNDIRLADISVGDYVTIGYYEGESGPVKVISLVVKYGKERK